MSTARPHKKILRIRDRQAAVLEELLASPPLLRGSLVRVTTRCGKPTCWCAGGTTGHAHTRLGWSQDGRMTTRKVPAEEVERILTLTERYRRFRQLRRELVRLQRQLHDAIGAFETALIEQTRKPLDYLALTQNPQPNREKTVAKRGKTPTDMLRN